jgi:hypothetical protein
MGFMVDSFVYPVFGSTASSFGEAGFDLKKEKPNMIMVISANIFIFFVVNNDFIISLS